MADEFFGEFDGDTANGVGGNIGGGTGSGGGGGPGNVGRGGGPGVVGGGLVGGGLGGGTGLVGGNIASGGVGIGGNGGIVGIGSNGGGGAFTATNTTNGTSGGDQTHISGNITTTAQSGTSTGTQPGTTTAQTGTSAAVSFDFADDEDSPKKGIVKRKKVYPISQREVRRIQIRNILYENIPDSQMVQFKKKHERLKVAFIVFVVLACLVGMGVLGAVFPEWAVLTVFMLVILTIGLIFSFWDYNEMLGFTSDMGYFAGGLGLYLFFAFAVCVTVAVVLGLQLRKNGTAILDRYNKLIMLGKTRVYVPPK
ncbi:MAG: hypothetical protein LBQ05_01680 [Christensenellaceae bacterium]|nr:hypothetical protein [Christensenellaceae bacterium]